VCVCVCVCVCVSLFVACDRDSEKSGVKLGLKGLDIMNDDPSQSHVLHMKVTPDTELDKLKQILSTFPLFSVVPSFAVAGPSLTHPLLSLLYYLLR
jgi:hypothetical protein